VPQVHGAVRDVLEHVRSVLEIETGSATDNPLIFPEDALGTKLSEEVISGGNFHGAPLAYSFDYAALALTDLASIAERRIDRLLNPDINEQLPAFLSPDPGLSSGFMIAQIVAAALIAFASVFYQQHSHRWRQGRSCVHGHDGRPQTPPDRGTG
jgi:histidine ammonia-lyase